MVSEKASQRKCRHRNPARPQGCRSLAGLHESERATACNKLLHSYMNNADHRAWPQGCARRSLLGRDAEQDLPRCLCTSKSAVCKQQAPMAASAATDGTTSNLRRRCRQPC